MKITKPIIQQFAFLIFITIFLYSLFTYYKIPSEVIKFALIPGIIIGALVIILQNRIPKKEHIIKIGIDIHGCIDFNPEFFATFSSTMVESGHQIHIMTGSEIKPAIIAELRGYGVMWTHLFSISDYYKDKPGIKFWRDEKGQPWVDPELWNKAKGIYAAEHQLDLVLDDTQEYGDYFTTSFAFCKIVNKSGKHRGPKAIMPNPPQE